MGLTAIQWTSTERADGTYTPGYTFNGWRGCTKISEGCKFCYADAGSRRNPAVLGVWGPHGTRVVAAESYWRQPLGWDRAARAAGERHKVFCMSLADVFEDWQGTMVDSRGNVLHYNSAANWWVPEPTMHVPVPMRFVRGRVASLIGETPNLDWLLLTKRPENAGRMLAEMFEGEPLPPNLWLGTTAEDQENADRRIPELLKIPAAVRFLSCEPLLGPVEFSDATKRSDAVLRLGRRSLEGIHWVIVGGESGARARARYCDLAWIRSIVGQCRAAGVPCFVKQIGTRPYDSSLRISISGPDSHSVEIEPGDPKGGDPDYWPGDIRVREFPGGTTPETIPNA